MSQKKKRIFKNYATHFYIIFKITTDGLTCFNPQSIKLSYLPNPSARAGYDTRSIFFKAKFNRFEFRVAFYYTSCLTKAEKPSLPNYIPIAGGRIIGFIPFPRVLVLCEMQSISSRIWTRVAVSISRDDNHYTTGTSVAIIDLIISSLM